MMLLNAIRHNLFDNPILTRELRRRIRGKALVFSIIGYIVLMSISSILILLASQDPFTAARSQDTQKMLESLAETGFTLFKWITAIQGLLVLIIAPTITAGMTTGEKEKKTFDFLRVTTITPWMYILGCFLSTVFYVSLALLCALPLISLAFLYGGISRVNVLAMGGVLLGCSMVLSSFGLLVSSVRDRTRTAQGIVVFMIFAALFGGSIIYRQVTIWLGTTAAAGGGGGGGTAGLLLFGTTVPSWALGAVGMLFLTAVFLLVATRKLFDPEETRALAHWQFALMAVGIIGTLLGLNKGLPLSNVMGLSFMALGSLLLATAALCFAVGRMEVGDEIWHLKRLFPFLRPFDQTVPFLILVGVAWYAAVVTLLNGAAGLGSMSRDLFVMAAVVGLLGYAFFCVFGRFATAVSVGRKGAGRMTLAVVLAAWVVVPLLAAACLAMAPNSEGFFADLMRGIGRLSPFYIMIEGISSPRTYTNLPSLATAPGVGAVFFYGLVGLVFLVVGEYHRFRRWRGFDYHYDMPAN